jgi:hypothetical protein
MGSADIVLGRVLKIHIRDDALTAEGRASHTRIRAG